MAGYVLALLLLVAVLHNGVWMRGFKRAIAREHPHHPEIDLFQVFAPPYRLLLNVVRFRQSRALRDLPDVERKLQYLHYRFQLFILATIPVSLIHAVGSRIG
jgi:hypothetical protein